MGVFCTLEGTGGTPLELDRAELRGWVEEGTIAAEWEGKRVCCCCVVGTVTDGLGTA